MSKFLPILIMVVILGGGIALYSSLIEVNRTHQDLKKHLGGFEEWGKRVGDWGDSVDRDLKAQQANNDSQLRQLNAIQAAIDGLAAKNRADEHRAVSF